MKLSLVRKSKPKPRERKPTPPADDRISALMQKARAAILRRGYP